MDRPLVYFLCIGNAMRSQMAEGFLRHHAGDRFDVRSAGTHPYGQVIPDVVAVMREVGIDIAHHTSDAMDPEVVERCVVVVDLGGRGRDRIPAAYRPKYRHWPVQDPYRLGPQALRRVRDEIRDRVLAFIAEWPPATAAPPAAQE